MAVLGKIRQRGIFLAIIIGIGLFAFITEEFFRSCETSANDRRQQVGEVLGEKINVQDYQKLVDEYTEAIKLQRGVENMTDEQLTQVRDMVWQSYVQNKIIESEAEKIGLTVTDKEMENILGEGTNPMLLQTPFVNQQTGRFDANALKKFIAEYKNQQKLNPQVAEQYSRIYKYWVFVERTIREQLLSQKYQNLFASCILSNPIEAKQAFNDRIVTSSIQLASFPYSGIADNKVKVSDGELKSQYEKMKERFRQYVESRDIKYISHKVVPSKQDRAEIDKQFAKFAEDMRAASDPTEVVRHSTSAVPYLGIPVKSSAFPSDIAAKIDSMSVGQTVGPFETTGDNTLNVIKLVSKQSLPDSIQYRQIQVAGTTVQEANQRADSIQKALVAGADFDALAKKYGQTGEKVWMTTDQYQTAPSMDTNTKKYINTLNTAAVNEIHNLNMGQGNVVFQILDRRGMTNKYTAAVIKKTIDFSKETYSAAFNKFSTFISANNTPEKMEKNAKKAGYSMEEAQDITTATHYLVGLRGTRDALKWLFEAKEGEVSPMFECGDNDNILVVVLEKIHPQGYRSLDDPQVNSIVKAEVMRDKKAETLMEKAEKCKSVSQAQARGANVTTVNEITFEAPVFVASTGSSEPALSGAVAATPKNKFSTRPVKGNGGVYVFQVTEKVSPKGNFIAKDEEMKLRQKFMQTAGGIMNELYLNAGVVDNRYLFF